MQCNLLVLRYKGDVYLTVVVTVYRFRLGAKTSDLVKIGLIVWSDTTNTSKIHLLAEWQNTLMAILLFKVIFKYFLWIRFLYISPFLYERRRYSHLLDWKSGTNCSSSGTWAVREGRHGVKGLFSPGEYEKPVKETNEAQRKFNQEDRLSSSFTIPM